MAQPFKFRYVNEIVGAFVLGAIALVVVAVVTIGLSQRWFTPVQTVVLVLPPDVSSGLRKGSDVVINGTVAGSVQDVTPSAGDPRASDVTLGIPRNFMASVHRNSDVRVRRALGGVGDAYVEILRGTGSVASAGVRLEVPKDNVETNPAEAAQETILAIRNAAVPMMNNFAQVAADLHAPEGNFQKAVANANRIAGSVAEGHGVAGRLVSDPALGEQVAQAVPKMSAAVDDLRKVLQDAQKTTAQLPQMTATLNEDMRQIPALMAQTQETLKQVNAILADVQKTTAGIPETTRAVNQSAQALPGLVLQTQETLRQIQRLVEGAQRSWLMGGAVPQEPARGGRIGADRVAP